MCEKEEEIIISSPSVGDLCDPFDLFFFDKLYLSGKLRILEIRGPFHLKCR